MGILEEKGTLKITQSSFFYLTDGKNKAYRS